MLEGDAEPLTSVAWSPDGTRLAVVGLDGRLRTVSVYFRDYRTEGGLTTPRLLETKYDGTSVSRKMTITKVVKNEPMQDALFQKPQLAFSGGSER